MNSYNKQILLDFLPNRLKDHFKEMTKNIKIAFTNWIIYVGLLETMIPLERNKIITSVISKFLFPKIDMEITKQISHLLRMPFSIHKNLNICIPILPGESEVINFDNILTLPMLINNFDYHKKKFEAYTQYVERFVLSL